MDAVLPFISLIFLSAGLGIDNGLLIEFSLKTLKLPPKLHLIWRSIALVLAAALRVLFLFSLSKLEFLSEKLPDYAWLPNRWFAHHESTNPVDAVDATVTHHEQLTWMSFVLFMGGLIILAMALWEYYHKLRSEMKGHEEKTASATRAGAVRILAVGAYLLFMNILFSLDSVFAAVAIMDLETQFAWMVVAILIASLIMVFGMIPISAIIARNKHFGVLMLSILAVIATKLLVDGTGSHFSNGLLIFIIVILLLNDAAQALIDRASRNQPVNDMA